MKFTVNARDFRDALRGCEKAVSKDQTREVLMYAHLVVTHDLVTLTALDGFQMIQYKLAARETEYGSLKAEALIPPKLVLSAIHSTKNDATVEIDAGQLRVKTDLTIEIALPHLEGEYPNYDKIWPDPKREQYKIAVNPKYLIQIAQACAAAAADTIDNLVWLEVPANPVHPIVISAKSDLCAARGLICPVNPRKRPSDEE